MKYDKILTPEFLQDQYVVKCKTAQKIADEQKCSKHSVLIYLAKAGINRRSCIKDLENKQFGQLTVIKSVGRDKFNRVKWECLCSCGKTTIVDSTNLIEGITQSCGCLKHLTHDKSKKWKGYKDISKVQWSFIKNGALVRDIPFNITIEDGWEQYTKQNGRCALTGLILDFNKQHDKYNGSASLDRINPNKGYTKDNIQWVHKYVNIMKWSFTTEEFIKMCKLVVDYTKPGRNNS